MPAKAKNRSGKNSNRKNNKLKNKNINTSQKVQGGYTDISSPKNTQTNQININHDKNNNFENPFPDESHIYKNPNVKTPNLIDSENSWLIEKNLEQFDRDNSTSGIKSVSESTISSCSGKISNSSRLNLSNSNNFYNSFNSGGDLINPAKNIPNPISFTDDENEFLSNHSIHSDVTTKSSNPYKLNNPTPIRPTYRIGGPLDQNNTISKNISNIHNTDNYNINSLNKNNSKIHKSDSNLTSPIGSDYNSNNFNLLNNLKSKDIKIENNKKTKEAKYIENLNATVVQEYFIALLAKDLLQDNSKAFTSLYDFLPITYTEETVNNIKDKVRKYTTNFYSKDDELYNNESQIQTLKAKASWSYNRIVDTFGEEFGSRLENERKTFLRNAKKVKENYKSLTLKKGKVNLNLEKLEKLEKHEKIEKQTNKIESIKVVETPNIMNLSRDYHKSQNIDIYSNLIQQVDNFKTETYQPDTITQNNFLKAQKMTLDQNNLQTQTKALHDIAESSSKEASIIAKNFYDLEALEEFGHTGYENTGFQKKYIKPVVYWRLG